MSQAIDLTEGIINSLDSNSPCRTLSAPNFPKVKKYSW